ncbi:MAG: FkbM family methyltransferase [Kiritimatiellae bacterium]|nr:FkbM family methyltransferase [Kiritimatiellia bacterium]
MKEVKKKRSQFQKIHRRFLRAIRIMQTRYWSLIADDGLNTRLSGYPLAKMETISREGGWDVLQINDFRFFWPNALDNTSLRSIYRDTFTPAEDNPHAFEYGDVRIVPGEWVVDAGACEGFFTHFALRKGANVLAVEPVPALAEGLTRTFAAEIKVGRVQVLQGVLGNHDETTTLVIPRDAFFAATTDQAWGHETGWFAGAMRQDTTSYTIDRLLEQKLVPRIDFLKMDVENSELSAMSGAKQLLRDGMPKLVIAVYHDYLNAEALRSLILENQAEYKVRFRGIFIKEAFGPPRPFMLYASRRRVDLAVNGNSEGELQ